MAVKPHNVTVSRDLTEYAHGVMQDAQAAIALIHALAPIVPTGATNGAYNKFDNTQAFVAYAKAIARRAVGGQASAITLLSDSANYACDPYGLRISIDAHERNQAGDAGLPLLRMSKTRTLTINCLVSFLNDVVTTIKAAVSAEADKGDWSNPNVDPIAEIDDAINAVYLAVGVVPNHVFFDFGGWLKLKNNPNILSRMPGADLARVTPERVAGLLGNPTAKITIAETSMLTGGGLGNSDATRVGILGGSVFIAYNSPMATPYDPSFCKTFSPSSSLFTEVYSYREEPHLDWYENDWTCDVEVVSALLCKRIDVSGATG